LTIFLIFSQAYFLQPLHITSRDYVTEKFIGRLSSFVVPIVFGRDSYANHDIPESALIYVDDFCSIQALADYLVFLGGNFTAYSRYFKWREKFKVR